MNEQQIIFKNIFIICDNVFKSRIFTWSNKKPKVQRPLNCVYEFTFNVMFNGISI